MGRPFTRRCGRESCEEARPPLFYFELAKTIQPCYNEHMFEETNAISLDGCRHFGIIKERENYEYFLSFE
jgi:hypothetical protein